MRNDPHLPGDQYPDWFMYKCDGRSLVFKVPEAIGSNLKAMLLSIVYCSCMDNETQFHIDILIINYTKGIVHHHKLLCETSKEDEEWESSIISSFEPGNVVELVLNIGPQFPVNIAAYLIYDSSKHNKSLAKKVVDRFVRIVPRFPFKI